jgi:hypothetical protein
MNTLIEEKIIEIDRPRFRREKRDYVHLPTVFKQRLGLQSVQKLMESKFKILNTNLLLDNNYLIKLYNSFDEETKHRFAHDLGGPTNTGLTKNYLENLVRNNK